MSVLNNLLRRIIIFSNAASLNWGAPDAYNRMFFKSAENYINECLRYRGYITWEKINDVLGVTPKLNDLNNISVYKYMGKILRLDVKQITFDLPSYEISFREE